MGAINQAPEVGSASTTFNADVPQIFVNIDRTRAEALGLSVGEIYSTIGANSGSRYFNDFTLEGRVYQVNLAAGADYRSAAEDVLNLYARNDAGAMVPLRTVASTTTLLAPYVISRYNLPVAINGQAAADASSGDGSLARSAGVRPATGSRSGCQTDDQRQDRTCGVSGG